MDWINNTLGLRDADLLVVALFVFVVAIILGFGWNLGKMAATDLWTTFRTR